jgi:hypothetical protein
MEIKMMFPELIVNFNVSGVKRRVVWLMNEQTRPRNSEVSVPSYTIRKDMQRKSR